MNKNIKLITNYKASQMTETDLTIIDCLNNEFVSLIKNNETIESFCNQKPFSSASVHRVAKKLGYKSFIDMKFDLISKYINKIERLFNIDNNIENNVDRIFASNFDIDEYLSFLKISLSDIDWTIINQMKKDILSISTIYVFQYDKIFEFSGFDIYCSLKKIHLVRLTSLQSFEFFKKIPNFDSNSIFIFTKFNKLSEVDNNFLEFLNYKKIKTYLFTAVLQSEKQHVKQIVIGNFKRISYDKKLFTSFKMIYDQLINIIIYSLFSKEEF